MSTLTAEDRARLDAEWVKYAPTPSSGAAWFAALSTDGQMYIAEKIKAQIAQLIIWSDAFWLWVGDAYRCNAARRR